MFVPWVALLATELGPLIGGLAGGAATGLYFAAGEMLGFPHDPVALTLRLAPLVAVAADYLNTLTAERALEHMRAYRPDTYIPAHHDGAYNELWRATEPIFQALKQENPALVTVSRGYREPMCFDTTRKRQ